MSVEVTELEVHAELVGSCPGFAMDFGGSTIKVIYKKPETEVKEGLGKLHMVCFEKCQVGEAIDFIREHAFIERPGSEPPTMYVTGVGAHLHQHTFTTQLQVRFKVLPEFDCILAGFHYTLHHLSRPQLVHALDTAALSEPLQEMTERMKAHQFKEGETSVEVNTDTSIVERLRGMLGDKAQATSPRPLADSEDIYPCLLTLIGSGGAFIKVESDGSFKIVDGGSRAGKTVYGLGTILTGCQSYEEFLELAARGNDHAVNTYIKDVYAENAQVSGDTDDDNIYAAGSSNQQDTLIYFFGKGVKSKSGEFQREDLARALLLYFIHEFTHLTQLAASAHGCKHVFFGGGFVNSSLVRSIMTAEMTRRILLNAMLLGNDTIKYTFDFLIPGPHLGAVGALCKAMQENENC